MRQVEILAANSFDNFKISVKASDVLMAISAYRQIADLVDAPLHIGITEAGSLIGGTVRSAIGLGALLLEGIGDTIRVSLASDPVNEVRVAWDMLKCLGLRYRGVRLIACPSCSRQNFDVIATGQRSGKSFCRYKRRCRGRRYRLLCKWTGGIKASRHWSYRC